MSQGFSNSRASSPFDDPNRMGGTAELENEEEQPAHALDSHQNQERLAKLRDWYEQEWQRQAANRYQMALDEDYYDSMQWTEEDAQELLERGQAPLVFNEIKPTIDWMLGTERRTRIDHKVLARKKDKPASQNAESKSSLMKYLSDVNKTPYHRSTAFADAVKAGVGWIETGVRGDPTDELSFTRRENWRNIIYDSNSVERDGSDMRYLFRMRYLDSDIAEAYFPDRSDVIRESVQSGNSLIHDDEDFYYMGARVTQPGHDYQAGSVGKYTPYDSTVYAWSRRDRVKMIECWYRVPVLKRKFAGGELEGEVYDSQNPDHVEALKGQYSLYDKLEMEVRCAIFCDGGLVFDGKSPYNHGRIPFVPIWCYRRARDNAPYGAIRNLRDPQDDLNKRASKALFILSSNRVQGEKGAVDDWEELRREVARPDSVIITNPGKKLEISRDIALADEHLKLMERDVQHIRNSGGVNNENLGRTTNVTSGVALQERKDAGSVTTTEPFDNLRFAVQLIGEMELANIEQFYTDEKVVRILGERGGAKFIELNKRDPKTGKILNDITAFQSDFVVSEQDYRSSLRQAMFESLFDIIGRLAQMNPQVALNLLDLVIEMADLPNKDELVARIRKLNGQKDPDAELTPEEQAAAKQAEESQAAMASAQQQIALQTMQKQLSKLVAETEKLDAQAMREKITAMYSALQAAGVVSTIPGAAAVADEILHGAGYVDAATKHNAEMIAQAADAQQQNPGQQVPALDQADAPAAAAGVMNGIETPQID